MKPRRSVSFHIRIALALACLAWFSLLGQALAAVTLVSFTATPAPGQAILRWETASEVKIAGYYITRSLQAAGSYSRVSPLIPALGEGIGGATYEFIDTGLTDGTVYYFKLEVIETDNTSTFHGPIFTTPGNATYTPTPSQTPTSTRTPTASPVPTTVTPPGANPTQTASLPASQPTAVINSPTATPSATRTSVSTPLTPPPELTLQKTLTPSSTMTATLTPPGSLEQPTNAPAGTQVTGAPTQSLLQPTVPPPGWLSPTPAPFTPTLSPTPPAEPAAADTQPDLFQLISLGLLGAVALGGGIYWALFSRNQQK